MSVSRAITGVAKHAGNVVAGADVRAWKASEVGPYPVADQAFPSSPAADVTTTADGNGAWSLTLPTSGDDYYIGAAANGHVDWAFVPLIAYQATPGSALPSGGTVGQVLTKKTDGTLAWATPGTTINPQQIGPLVKQGSGSSITATLQAASKPETLLTCWVTGTMTGGSSGIALPAGWVKVCDEETTSAGIAELWKYENNPGGISSASITSSLYTASGYEICAQMQEWNLAAASSSVDQTGGFTLAVDDTMSITISTTGAVVAAGELAICVLAAEPSSAVAWTSTLGPGWILLGNNDADAVFTHVIAAYMIGPPTGADLAQTVTLSGQAHSGASGVIATFEHA